MAPIASMCAVLVALAVMPPILSPGAAFAQAMQQPGGMMMHGTLVEGVVSQIRYISCGSAPDSCQAIIQITPAAMKMMGSPEPMMQHPETTGGSMMGPHPVTVIVVPGTALVYQNSSLLLTRLKVGDSVTCEYQTHGDMNVVTKVMLTGMGHM